MRHNKAVMEERQCEEFISDMILARGKHLLVATRYLPIYDPPCPDIGCRDNPDYHDNPGYCDNLGHRSP